MSVVYFRPGSFGTAEFPSYAGQSFEYLEAGNPSQAEVLHHEEYGGDLRFIGYYYGFDGSYAGWGLEDARIGAIPSRDTVQFTIQGNGDTTMTLGFFGPKLEPIDE
jgi:hypothetical protein